MEEVKVQFEKNAGDTKKTMGKKGGINKIERKNEGHET